MTATMGKYVIEIPTAARRKESRASRTVGEPGDETDGPETVKLLARRVCETVQETVRLSKNASLHAAAKARREVPRQRGKFGAAGVTERAQWSRWSIVTRRRRFSVLVVERLSVQRAASAPA